MPRMQNSKTGNIMRSKILYEEMSMFDFYRKYIRPSGNILTLLSKPKCWHHCLAVLICVSNSVCGKDGKTEGSDGV